MINNIINYFHLILLIFLITSPFIEEYTLKINAFMIITFILFHFILKYGKCGIINIEKFFLKENFKNGFFYRLIKPVISYKNNIFYDKLFYIIVLYYIILFIQIYNSNCIVIIYKNVILHYNSLVLYYKTLFSKKI